MAVQKNGDSTVSVVNVPSEGTQRAVANGIGIKANGPAGTPVMVTASVADSEDNIMFNGFASTINAAVYDGQLNKMNVTPQYSSSLKGTWSGSAFTPAETGNGTVTVTYGDISKTIDVTVLKGVAALRAEAYSYALVTGQKTALTAKAINPEGYSLDIAQSDVTWSVDDSGVGHIDNGSFVADKDGLCTVTARSEKYGVTGTLQINVGKKYVAINSFEGPRNIVNTYYPSSDSGISGGGAIDGTISKDGRSSLRIDYSFKPDTVTTQCVYASLEKNEILFPSGVSDFEIWYKGENVMLGYYNMPELTAETVVDGWFNTGDLGFFDSEGWLYITGRKKNIIVTKNGENIYPEEIEDIINKYDEVSDSMVYALDRSGNDIVAVQILPDKEYLAEKYGEMPSDEEIEKIMKDIISEVNDKLPTFKIIRDVTVRKEDFIRTTTRKIKRAANI